MINLLSYVGMSAQSELCLWTLLGLLRTIFDATLFKVNANLKQVWQMAMPSELSLPVQRVLRTIISGVMLVQCFTVYVYLAAYIVLLYPVFLEERPTLVLPWLLLAAIRNFLCELTSLALGLGTCVLLGPARSPCIKFLITKLASIMPSFYMWMIIFSYYHNLKLASTFKTFPAVTSAYNLDYGLELAVRRRRTKSLQDENQLRKKLMASLYHENIVTNGISPNLTTVDESAIKSEDSSAEKLKASLVDIVYQYAVIANRTTSDIGTYEDWFGSEVVVPRDTDRILEQFVLMLLRIGAFLTKGDSNTGKFLSSNSQALSPQNEKRLECTTIPTEDADTNPIVGNSKGRMASYLIDYPDIFMRKPSDILGPHNLSELKRLDTNLLDIKSLSSVSDTTKEISLDTVKLTNENKEFQPDSGNQMIDSNHGVYDILINDEIDFEHSYDSSVLVTQSAEVNTISSDNVKNIINTMIDRASMPSEEQRNETTQSITEPSNKDSLPMSSSQRKKTVSIKDKSEESLTRKERNMKINDDT